MVGIVESRKYSPAGLLSGFVECFWYWQGAPQTHAKERLMPNGEASIIFNLYDDPIFIYDAEDTTQYRSHGCALISGPRTNCFVIDTKQEERVFGIQFKPGGTFPFLRAARFRTQKYHRKPGLFVEGNSR